MVTKSVAVDDTLSNGNLLSLGYSLRGVTPANVQFFTAPVLGTNWNYNANFGTPKNRFAFTSPRAFRLTFGVRF